jgi:cytochrome c-type biogenesis protein CcmH
MSRRRAPARPARPAADRRPARRIGATVAACAVAAGLLLAAATVPSGPALALQPWERLEDPALEDRARDLSKGLRCVVCQNQSIDDSNAELAQDLRQVVRERLVAGDTDDEVIDYVVARYGDYVLMKPPMSARTLLLWFGPAMVVVGAAVWATMAATRRRGAALAGPPPLSDAERRRLAELTGGGAEASDPDGTDGRGGRG